MRKVLYVPKMGDLNEEEHKLKRKEMIMREEKMKLKVEKQ
jgi:hypothetical protein